MNKNCDIASISDWASERVSLFQSASELIVVASKQQNVGRSRSEKSKRLHDVPPTFFGTFLSVSSTFSQEAHCQSILPMQAAFRDIVSAVCIMLLTSRIVQHFITQRFSLWDAQCVYRALECFELMRQATCTFKFTCHCPCSVIIMLDREVAVATTATRLALLGCH